MTEAHALQIIRDVSESSERVFFTKHAKAQMRKRSITNSEVLRVLRVGHITEEPNMSTEGGWQTTVESFESGRNLRVIVAIDEDEFGNKVIIITAHTI